MALFNKLEDKFH